MENGSWQQVLTRFQQSILDLLFLYLPNLIGALLIFLVGWLIAGVASRLISGILQRVNFQNCLGKILICNYSRTRRCASTRRA